MRKGFTLLELVAVVAITAILIGIASYAAVSITRGARKLAMEKQEKVIEQQIERYYEFNGYVPKSQSDFVAFLSNPNYFPHIPINPEAVNDTGSSYGWKWYPSPTHPEMGTLSTLDGKYSFVVSCQKLNYDSSHITYDINYSQAHYEGDR